MRGTIAIEVSTFSSKKTVSSLFTGEAPNHSLASLVGMGIQQLNGVVICCLFFTIFLTDTRWLSQRTAFEASRVTQRVFTSQVCYIVLMFRDLKILKKIFLQSSHGRPSSVELMQLLALRLRRHLFTQILDKISNFKFSRDVDVWLKF